MKYLVYILSVFILSTSISFAASTSNNSNSFVKTIFDKVDSFRIEKRDYLFEQRDFFKDRIANQLATTGKKVLDESLGVAQPDPEKIGQTQSNNLGDPQDYFLFTLYAGIATVFDNSFYFYAVCIVVMLAIVRTIFRRAF